MDTNEHETEHAGIRVAIKASWLADNDGNIVTRYPDDSVKVTLSGRTQKTHADVLAWYWGNVGARLEDR